MTSVTNALRLYMIFTNSVHKTYIYRDLIDLRASSRIIMRNNE